MMQEVIMVDSVGPGGRVMIPVLVEPIVEGETTVAVSEESSPPKKTTRKKKTEEIIKYHKIQIGTSLFYSMKER